MVKRRFLLLLLFVQVVCATNLIATDFTLSLELKNVSYIRDKQDTIVPTAFLGDSFILKAIVNGKKQKALNEPTIEGLSAFRSVGTSNQSSMAIQNGAVSVEKTTSHTLIPKKLGTFTIGPAVLYQDGKTYKSNKVTINIAPQSHKSKATLTANKSGSTTNSAYPKLFCEFRPDKTEAFIEEPIKLSLLIYQTEQGTQIRGLQPPKFSDCTVKEIEAVKKYRTQKDGTNFIITEKQFLLYPHKPGQLTIPPAQVIYLAQRKRKRRLGNIFEDRFFSGFFGTGFSQHVAATNPLTLSIKPLPSHGKKADSVGTFASFEAAIDKTNVTVNEPIKYSLTLKGNANFDLILPPTLSLPDSFKSYDSQTDSTENSKTFEFIIQIPQEGVGFIPAQEFSYFDVETKKYATLETKPISITVSIPHGAQTEGEPIEAVPITKQKPLSTTDIHFIDEEAKPTKSDSYTVPTWLMLILIACIPMLFFIKQIETYIVPFLHSLMPSSKNRLHTYEKKLAQLIEQNDHTKMYNLFLTFLAESYGLTTKEISEQIIQAKLAKSRLSKEKIEEFIRFLNQCAQYSFSSDRSSSDDLNNAMQKARYWLLLINQTITKEEKR